MYIFYPTLNAHDYHTNMPLQTRISVLPVSGAGRKRTSCWSCCGFDLPKKEKTMRTKTIKVWSVQRSPSLAKSQLTLTPTSLVEIFPKSGHQNHSSSSDLHRVTGVVLLPVLVELRQLHPGRANKLSSNEAAVLSRCLLLLYALCVHM